MHGLKQQFHTSLFTEPFYSLKSFSDKFINVKDSMIEVVTSSKIIHVVGNTTKTTSTTRINNNPQLQHQNHAIFPSNLLTGRLLLDHSAQKQWTSGLLSAVRQLPARVWWLVEGILARYDAEYYSQMTSYSIAPCVAYPYVVIENKFNNKKYCPTSTEKAQQCKWILQKHSNCILCGLVKLVFLLTKDVMTNALKAPKIGLLGKLQICMQHQLILFRFGQLARHHIIRVVSTSNRDGGPLWEDGACWLWVG